MLARDHGAGLHDHGAQLLARHGFLAVLADVDAEQHEYAVGKAVYHPDSPDHGIPGAVQETEDIGGREGKALGAYGGHGLGRNLAEYQQQRREHQRGHKQAHFAYEPERHHRGQRHRQVVHQVVSQQDQTDQSIRLAQQGLGKYCALATLTRQVPQAIAIQGHQTGLGTGEKGRQQDQTPERAQ